MAPPKRNQRQNARKSATSNGLTPYSVPMTPPANPPVVELYPKRKLLVDFDTTSTGSGPFEHTLTLNNLRTAVEKQTGWTDTRLFLVIHYICVWGDLQPSSEITITDPEFGTASTGNGQYDQRARAGFSYPRNVAPLRGPQLPGTLVMASTVVDAASQPLTYRVSLTAWMTPV